MAFPSAAEKLMKDVVKAYRLGRRVRLVGAMCCISGLVDFSDIIVNGLDLINS